MLSTALFVALAKATTVVAGACAIAYQGYKSMPSQQAKNKLTKLFKDGSVYKVIKRKVNDKTYDVKLYPDIKRVGLYKDRLQIIFSVPDGMNPQEITGKLWLFKQGFGERVDLTGDSKTFNLEVYEKELQSFAYDADEIGKAVNGYKLPIIAGKTRKGYIVYDMCEHPHLLIAGETGSGKSVQLRSILSTLIACAGDRVELHCADLKRSEFYLFRNIARTVDVEPLKLQSTLLQIKKELIKRGNMLDKAELSNINDLPDDKRPKYIVLAIDEVALLKKEKAIMEIVEEISAIGRALGVFLILSMQRPDANVLDGKLKNNLTVRMGFRHADEINSRITLGSGEAAHIKQSQRGMFYLSLDGLKQVHSPHLTIAAAKTLLVSHKKHDTPPTTTVIDNTEVQEVSEIDYIEFGGLDYDDEG